MTIKEKVTAYDEALKVANKYKDTHIMFPSIKDEMFPELKESEDERIRKALLEMVHDTTGDSLWVDYNVHKEDAIAWLEKQGEQKSIIEMKSPEESLGIDSDTYNKIVDECIYGEQKHTDKVEPKFKVGQTIKKEGFNLGFPIVKIENGFYYNDMGDNFPFTDQDNWKLVEQKPAWSEEDDKMFNSALWHVKNSCGNGGKNSGEFEVYYWLKSLKDRVQPQSIAYYNPYKEVVKSIVEMCKHYDRLDVGSLQDFYDNVKVKCKDAKEYESLFPQNTWKPSEEQIEALERECMAHSNYDLCRLCEQLKKLREE